MTILSKRVKRVWFYEEIYRNNYLFLIGELKDCIKYARKHYDFPLEEGACGDGKAWEIVGYGYCIWLPKFNHEPKIMDTLVHEITHATLWTMQAVNIKLDEKNEAYAYHSGFLMRKFLELVNKK